MRTSRREFLGAAGALAGAVVLGTPGRAAAALPTRAQVIGSMRLAADYWMSRPPMYGNDNNWHNGTLYSGFMALYGTTGDTRYSGYTRSWATLHDYQLMADSASKPFHADKECAAQPYMDLNALDHDPHQIAATRNRADAQLASGRSDYWTWVDALHMAMPVFVRLGGAYTTYAASGYAYTRGQLWDARRGLWWRDGGYVGSRTYWSRGNGWAIAALAKVLTVMSSSGYVADLRAMASALGPLQRQDGFWNAGLTDPRRYAGPESSGTAFFAYGLAWGINHGILDPAVHRPVVERAWQALTTVALQPSGLLGYVQGPGAKPSDNYPWGPTDTQPYAVGGFLLAGSEVAKLAS